jgi:hypothetical protein
MPALTMLIADPLLLISAMSIALSEVQEGALLDDCA